MTGLPPGSTIGIIGGGQLGRMLAMAAARLSYRIVVLEPGKDCPAAQVANRHIEAGYDDPAALTEFARACAAATYEFENVPVAAVGKLASKVPVFPPPKALEMAQDRLVEKEFLNRAGLKTAPCFQIDSDDDLRDALERLGGNGVLKTRRLGYDGKGQKLFRRADPDSVGGVYESMGGVALILEGLVPFKREISVIAARSDDGSFRAYDPAENVHRDGILHTSTVPAAITYATAAQALEYTRRATNALDYIGVIGVEYFVLDDQTVIANEFAPRVHNSGHWTEAACAVSQFEQHIRAIVGLPLGSTGRHSNCVMENLTGDEAGRLESIGSEPDTVVHLYGKTEIRPGRKMGHFTQIMPIRR